MASGRRILVLALAVALVLPTVVADVNDEDFSRAEANYGAIHALGDLVLAGVDDALNATLHDRPARAQGALANLTGPVAALQEVAAQGVGSSNLSRALAPDLASLDHHAHVTVGAFATLQRATTNATADAAAADARGGLAGLLADADALDAQGYNTTELRALVHALEAHLLELHARVLQQIQALHQREQSLRTSCDAGNATACQELQHLRHLVAACRGGNATACQELEARGVDTSRFRTAPPRLLLQATPTNPALGDPVAVAGTLLTGTFATGHPVNLTLDGRPVATVLTREGAFGTNVTVPPTAGAGPHVLAATTTWRNASLHASVALHVTRVPTTLHLVLHRGHDAVTATVQLTSRGAPLAGPLTARGLGDVATADGSTATLVLHGDLGPGDHAVVVTYPGTSVYAPATARGSVHVASPGLLPAWAVLPAWVLLALLLALLAFAAARWRRREAPEAPRRVVFRVVPRPPAPAPDTGDATAWVVERYRGLLTLLEARGLRVGPRTPREIMNALARRGHDPPPLRRVTGVFEAARYAGRRLTGSLRERFGADADAIEDREGEP